MLKISIFLKFGNTKGGSVSQLVYFNDSLERHKKKVVFCSSCVTNNLMGWLYWIIYNREHKYYIDLLNVVTAEALRLSFLETGFGTL